MEETPTTQQNGTAGPTTPEPPTTEQAAAEQPPVDQAQSRADRKAAESATRTRPPWIPILIVAIAVLTLVGLALAYRAFSDRLEAARRIDQAKTLIERADDVVVRVDEVVLKEVTPELAAEAQTVQRDVPRARADLQRAIDLLDEADDRAGDRDRRLAGLLRQTATSRIEMLDAADQILPLNVSASQALDPARRAWNALLEADKLSDQAVAEYNKLTKQAVTESSRLNNRASSLLTNAETDFTKAEEAFDAAPFEQYLSYVDNRQQLNALSRQSDAAWLKGDITKANQLIKQYNEGDKKSVQLARELPDAPEKAIADTYSGLAADPTEDYYAAREKATEADEQLKRFQ